MSTSIGGSQQADLALGSTFDLDVIITSDAADFCNSAIFRVVFSKPGLLYESYAWSAPFSAGSIFDQSKPGLGSLSTVITAATLQGPNYPAGIVDVEFANAAVGSFTSGLLVRMTLQVPDSFELGDLMISVVPDTIAFGLSGIDTTAGDSVEVTVVPGPGAFALMAFGSASTLFGCRRRRANAMAEADVECSK
ncbi:MAG: hypothetical protein SGJ11_05020 [Phycisphaerae bacterium]|nr:hypothetical protein [Phycisphaerae bacterium]